LHPHATAPPGAGGGMAHLRWLVRRIADDDRDAFGEFFDRLAGSVSSALHRQLSDPDQVAGVVAGTFVEVWWLAGGHVGADTDVLAWITEIVGRRVVDSRSFAPLPASIAATPAVPWARRIEAELGALLARRTP
jgi:DNA-directed RNA polymerase specialized sigma24 family protein